MKRRWSMLTFLLWSCLWAGLAAEPSGPVGLPSPDQRGCLRLSENMSWLVPPQHLFRLAKVVVEEGIVALDLEDRFFNPNPRQVEGVYRLALPEGGFVASFAMMTDGKNWIPGQVREIREARFIYEEIVGRRTDPGLLEQHGNELVLRVFPIESTAPVGIRVCLLYPAVPSAAGMIVPVPVGLGTTTADASPRQQPTSADDPSHSVTVPATPSLRLVGRITDSRGLVGAELTPAGGLLASRREAEFQLERDAAPDADPFLSVRLASPTASVKVTLRENGQSFRLLRLFRLPPPVATRGRPWRILVDGSGSMGGKQRERVLRTVEALRAGGDVRISSEADAQPSLWLLAQGKIRRTNEKDLKQYRFFGPTQWELAASFSAKMAGEATVLVTDGEGLSPSRVRSLWEGWGRGPLWIVHLQATASAEISSLLAERGGLIQWGSEEQWSTARTLCRNLGMELWSRPALLTANGECRPLFGRLSQQPGAEAVFLFPEDEAATGLEVRQADGRALPVQPGSGPVLDSRLPLACLAARQRIRTLEGREQTREVVAEITRLGLEFGQVTEYTALLALPEDVAAQNADVLNPALLGMLGGASFRKAREQARNKACFANMRVLLGAVEMYNMDHTAMMDPDPVTLELDIPTLRAGDYLKGDLGLPEPGCAYRGGPEPLTGSGRIFCLVHGYVEAEVAGESAETQFRKRCLQKGLDPDSYDLDFEPMDPDRPKAPLGQWALEIGFLLVLIQMLI